MTEFRNALRRFTTLAKKRSLAASFSAAGFVRRSIRDGSELTGAPGQPVRTSRLRNSWQVKSDGGRGRYLVFTDVEYAEFIEDGGNARSSFNPARGAPRSDVGGYHSVKLTRAAWPKIVAEITGRDGVRLDDVRVSEI